MPPEVVVDTKNLMNKFQEGFIENSHIWGKVLTGDVFKKLKEIRNMKEKEFEFPTDLWARVLFDMSIAYRDKIVKRDRMMDSLIPLYFGRTLSFVKKTRRMSIKQAEEFIEEDCMTFETTKPYLVQKWGDG